MYLCEEGLSLLQCNRPSCVCSPGIAGRLVTLDVQSGVNKQLTFRFTRQASEPVKLGEIEIEGPASLLIPACGWRFHVLGRRLLTKFVWRLQKPLNPKPLRA